MTTIKNLIRLISILTLFLAASPTMANASQPASTSDKLPGDFRNFQNFGSLGYQPTSKPDNPGNDFLSNEGVTTLNSTSLEMIGHLGGLGFAVALEGNYAYLVTQGELAVIDVSDPAHPVRAGYAAFPSLINPVRPVIVSKNRAYFISYYTGMVVVDVSDPGDPAYLGAVNPPESSGYGLSSLALFGDYAYLSKGGTLFIYDLSQPGLPKLVGSSAINTGYGYQEMTVSGHYAYAISYDPATQITSLLILDLTTPTAPQLIGRLDSLAAGPLSVQGNYAYIAGSVWEPERSYTSLQVVDVSNPATPSLDGSIEINTGHVSRVVVMGGRLYLAAPFPTPLAGLLIYSLQDPRQPVFQGSALASGDSVDVAAAPDLKHAFVADYGGGMRAIDVGDPAHPFEAGAFDPPSTVRSMGLVDGYAFTSSDLYGIRSVDISDPGHPRTVGYIPAWGNAYDLHVAGNYAYAAELNGGGIRVYDIADPAHMQEIAALGGSFNRMEVSDGYLYAWEAHNGTLSVIDIRNTTHPVEAGSYGTPYIDGVALTGSTAYIISNNDCLIVDFSDPGSPKDESQCSTGIILNIEISGSYAYLIAGDFNLGYKLRILDISNPTAPVQVGEVSIPKPPFTYNSYSISVRGNLVFLYGGQVGNLIMLDVSDPYAPRQVGSSRYGTFYAIDREGDTVYLGGDGGLLVAELASSITGRVTDASLYPVQEAEIQSSSGITATTGANGSYHLESLVAGSYTITPTLNGYTFNPSSRRVTLPTDTASQDFTLLPEPVSVTATPGLTATLTYTGYQGDATQFEISSGSFSQPAQVMVTPTIGANLPALAFTGHAFELSARDSQGPILDFAAPVTATISYTDFDVRFVTDENNLVLYRWTGMGWEDAAATCTPASAYTRDLTANQIFLPICQPGKYALYGPTHAILLPAILTNFR